MFQTLHCDQFSPTNMPSISSFWDVCNALIIVEAEDEEPEPVRQKKRNLLQSYYGAETEARPGDEMKSVQDDVEPAVVAANPFDIGMVGCSRCIIMQCKGSK